MTIRKPTPLARPFNHGAAKRETKWRDPFYVTPAYRAWARFIVNRAGRRCEAIDDGQRCTKTWPDHRMFADHIVERQDGGDPYSPANGQCLCYSHHTIKTMKVRAERLGSRSHWRDH